MAKINPNENLKLEHLDKTVNFITWALLIIVATLMFALGAMINDYLAMKQASYEDLKDKVIEQNSKVDSLNKTINLICKTWRKDCPN
jgi:hypothetical protein